MFRFGDRLAVEFEEQIGMTRLQELGRKILVAGDAGVCAHIKVAEIAHASGDAGVVGPIRAGVAAQPAAGGAVAASHRKRLRRDARCVSRLGATDCSGE